MSMEEPTGFSDQLDVGEKKKIMADSSFFSTRDTW